MPRNIFIACAAAMLATSLCASSASADACSGRDHPEGTILGGVLGGVIGGGATNGNAGGVIGGAILGGLAGNALARDMDCNDRPYAARSYRDSFQGPVGRRYSWRNGRNRGYVVTDREYRRGRMICRDFTQVVYRRGREIDRQGTACRPRRGGEWRFMG